jgi:hypothetical protein
VHVVDQVDFSAAKDVPSHFILHALTLRSMRLIFQKTLGIFSVNPY